MAGMAGKIPTPEEIIQFLTAMEGQPASKRDIAKHFRIKGQEARVDLKFLLKEMVLDGLIENDKVKTFRLPQPKPEGSLRDNIHLNVIKLNEDGELVCEPVNQNLKDDYKLIILDTNSAAGVGDTIIAELHPMTNDGEFMAKEIKKAVKREHETIMGVYRKKEHGPAVLQPLAKSLINVDFIIPTMPSGMQLKDGAVVIVRVGSRPSMGPTPVEIDEVISQEIRGTEIAIGIRNHELPHHFPEEVLTYTDKLNAISEDELKDREDLRHIPIVTIDGEDAKDFDDAVWAEPWESDKVKGGYHIIVAIADVAHYVKEGSSLDKEAFVRGNSVYFPGYVVPMLPEKLSNDLCSLRPHEDRPTMVAHMWIDAQGKLHKYKFTRAVIHSAARLTYNQVQQALKGDVPEIVEPVMESTIKPLYGAYRALLKYREKRGAIDLDVPETVIVMDDNDNVTSIEKRSRFDSHQLIEELMVLANVAAASELQTKGAPCLYRIHPEPSEIKMDALKLAFKENNLTMKGEFSPKAIQQTLKHAQDEHKETLYMTVLRSLEQARYDPENVGHFGLALERYAHFTSPIRRYSDLVVHRSLINQLKLAGHKNINQPSNLVNIADHLCITERRAQRAEWEVKDRLTVRYYRDFLEKDFVARITSLTKFGMFVSIDNGAAEGMLPYRLMVGDHFIFDEKKNQLFGRRTKAIFKHGDTIETTLIEADEVTGRLTFAPKGVSYADAEQSRKRFPKRSGGQGGRFDRKDKGEFRGKKTDGFKKKDDTSSPSNPKRDKKKFKKR